MGGFLESAQSSAVSGTVALLSGRKFESYRIGNSVYHVGAVAVVDGAEPVVQRSAVDGGSGGAGDQPDLRHLDTGMAAGAGAAAAAGDRGKLSYEPLFPPEVRAQWAFARSERREGNWAARCARHAHEGGPGENGRAEKGEAEAALCDVRGRLWRCCWLAGLPARGQSAAEKALLEKAQTLEQSGAHGSGRADMAAGAVVGS